jgi:tetratricopeptide (TPR) repeat protein
MPERRELTDLEKQAGERLAADDPIQAVALLSEAERAAIERDDGAALCGLLGDKAVAFRQLGNVQGAIDTYRRAIEYCRAAEDPLNLTRWLTNLAGLLTEHDRVPEAAVLLDELGDAAERCEDRSVAASGEGTIGLVLNRQERFAEAVGHFAAAEKGSSDPAIRNLWRQNGLIASLGWAASLEAEDRPADAADALEQALADASSVEDEELLRLSAEASAKLAVLHERAGAPDRSQAAVRKARDLLARLDDDQGAAVLDAVLGAAPRLPLGRPGTTSAAYGDALAAALADGRAEDALTARVNLAGALLLENDKRAFDEFEQALDEVEQRGDRRRELILLLNFAAPLVERGEAQRAVKLADRAVELARAAGGDRRALALLIRAKVRLDGAGDAAGAVDSARAGIRELEALAGAEAASILEDPGAAELVGRAAQIAVDGGDVETATTGLRLLGEDVPAPSPTVLDVDELRALSLPELDGPLAAWRATPRDADLPTPTQGMLAGLALLPGWEDAAARLANAAEVADPAGASAGGPAGVVRAAELAVAGEVAYDTARSVVAKFALDEDDAELLCLQLVVDRGGSTETATTLRLIAETTLDERLAGRVYRLLVMLAHGQPELGFRFAEEGLDRLAGGTDEPLRADLLNETAHSLVMLGRTEEGLERAEEARALALAQGAERLAALAGGNVGFALMNLGRLEEARSTLTAVAAEYERLGDTQAVEATRFNLEAIRMQLGEPDEDAFSGESDDPDEVLAKAAIVAESGDTFRAIKLFERAFELVEAAPFPYAREPYARSDYANVLIAARRFQAAARQLELAGEVFDRRGDPAAALGIDVCVATLLYDEPERALPFARRAVARAEQGRGAAAKAATLGILGEVLLRHARFADAIDAFERSLELHPVPALVPSLAQALIGAGRPAEALQLCERDEPPDMQTAARTLAARAEAHAALGSADEALALASDAYSLASLLPPDRSTLDIAGRFGAMLAESGRAREGTDLIEATLEEARTLGIEASERSLLIELGVAMVALGDLEEATAVLRDVAEELLRIGDDRGLARASLARGHAAAARGRFEEALELYGDTEHLATKTGNELLRMAALDATGTVYAELGRPGRAGEYHRRAADGRIAAGSRMQAMESRFHLADSLARVPDGRAAEASLNEAVALRDELGLAPRWSEEFVRARVQVARGDWPAAAATFRSSLEQLESERDEFLTPSELRRARRLDGDAYGFAAAAAVAAGDGETALELVEAGRGRFLDALVERRAQRPEGVDEDTWLDYERTTDELADLRAQRRARAAAPDPKLDAAFVEVKRRHAEAAERVRAAQSQAPAAKRDLRRFAELVDALPVGCAAVALDVSRDGLEIICAGRSAEGDRWAEARLEPAFTDEELTRLLEADEPASTCGELGARIWPAVLGLLPRTKGLLLLPSSGLNVLPLHAAVLPGGTRACDRFSITYAPSIGLARRAGARAAPPAAPVLGQAVPPAADLRFTAAEAAEVAEAHDGELVKLEAAEATVEDVRRLLDECDAFHFCGHGAFEPVDPLASSLACADGRLTARSILAGPAMRARLVVLSACESGRVEAGDRLDDFVGLPGTFVAAGAAEVVATMWEVDDLAASLFVDRFFETWAGGRSPATDALAAAQRLLRHELSVADVQDRLRTWADSSDDERLHEAAAAWAARTDVEARPFAGETYWAPFHLVGAPLIPEEVRWSRPTWPSSGPPASASSSAGLRTAR